jgi:HEAT repeat protein
MTQAAPQVAFSPEELRRIELIDRLTVAGTGGLDELLAMLADPSWTVRRAVVAALAAGGTAVVEPLCRVLLTQRDSEARIAAAVDALAGINGNADGTLIAMIPDAPAPVLADIAQILGRRRTTIGVTPLVALCRHTDDNVAVAAMEALGRIGGRAAVDSLVDAVNSQSFFRTFPAIDVLGRSADPRAVAPLTALLDKPQYAAEAARALGRTGDLAAVVPLMRFLVRAGNATVRVAALALKDLHRRHRERFGTEAAVDQAIHNAGGDGGVVRQLTRALGDGDPTEKAAICFVLGALRDPSTAQVLTRLLDAPPEVADAAAGALRRLGPEADAEILRGIRDGAIGSRRALLPLVTRASGTREIAQCLTDPDPDVRAAACDALARMGVSAVVGGLFPLLADTNPRVSYAAVAAIQSLGSRETERLAVGATRSADPRVRRAAFRILTYLGSISALDQFLAALGDPDEKVREAALAGLPFMDDPRALEALLAATKNSSERTRAAAMRSLGHCSGNLRVTSYLLKGLGDPDAWVRYYACQALGRLAYEPAAEAIMRLLADPAGQVRVAAVEALSCLSSEVATGALRRALADPDGDIQRAALIGLGVGKHTESLPFMLAATRSSDPATRLVALSAIAGFRTPEVLAALRDAVSDIDPSVRAAALGFLAATPGVATTGMLADLLRTAADDEGVLSALSVHVEGRITGLLAALETADDEVAAAIIAALSRLQRPDATAAVMGAMALPNVAARKAAAGALAVLASKEALTTLEHAAADDPAPEVRQICAVLLAR